MPKRRNPFGDDSPLQFKTHVRTKELNAGICGENNLKSIYEKTKDMLFSGARKNLSMEMLVPDANCNHPMLPNNNNNNNNNNLFVPLEASASHPAGQMIMNQEGQLMPGPGGDTEQMDMTPSVSSSHTDSSKYSWDFFKKKSQPPSQMTLSPTKDSCCFCEKVFLNCNTAQCCSCGGVFCQLCSTTNYDESTERIFCLNCCP